jgi:hypothetical protein
MIRAWEATATTFGEISSFTKLKAPITEFSRIVDPIITTACLQAARLSRRRITENSLGPKSVKVLSIRISVDSTGDSLGLNWVSRKLPKIARHNNGGQAQGSDG